MKIWSKFLIFIFLLSFELLGARFAVLIGNNTGDGNLPNLKYVKNDLNAIKNILLSNCNFKESNISIAYNNDPSEIKSLLYSSVRSLNKDDLFFFYYTGHADHKSLIMGKNRFPLSELKTHLKSISSNMKIMVFDACQSGSFARLKGGTVSSPFLIHEENSTEGQVVLYSSSDTEFSQESDYYKQSIFTFHLVNALKGCADESGDKQITLNEAYHYAYNQTVSSTINSAGGIQHPGYLLNIQGKGNVILADMRSKYNGIVVDKSIKGSIAVLDDRNNIISDIIKKDENDIFLALNSGKYSIYNNNDQKISKTKINLTGSTIHHLKGEQLKPVRSIPIYTKGGSVKKTTISLITNGGFSLIDHSTLTSSMEIQYSALSQYHISPKLPLNKEQWLLGAGYEIAFSNGIFLYNGYNYNKISEKTSFSGYNQTPEDTTKYPVSLSVARSLKMHEINLGIGYTFKNTAIRFFSIATGLDLMIPKLNTDTKFIDYLYQINTSIANSEKGFLILPTLTLRFEYPITSIFSLGSSFKYRFQLDSQELLGNYDTLEYDLKGLSTMLRIKLNLNGK